MLDLSSFEKSVNFLREVIEDYNSKKYIVDDRSEKYMRGSIIQRFEYTYDFSLKTIRRILEIIVPSIDSPILSSFNGTIREANDFGLLKGNLKNWANYREQRNITSHTYEEEKAIDVVTTTKEFLPEAEFLLNKLKEKNVIF